MNSFDLVQHTHRQRSFSLQAFGPNQRLAESSIICQRNLKKFAIIQMTSMNGSTSFCWRWMVHGGQATRPSRSGKYQRNVRALVLATPQPAPEADGDAA